MSVVIVALNRLRRQLRDDSGAVSAEFAITVPAILLVLGLAIGAIMLSTQRLTLISAAADIARLEARGDSAAAQARIAVLPEGTRLSRNASQGIHCVTVYAQPAQGLLALIQVEARGCAAVSGEGGVNVVTSRAVQISQYHCGWITMSAPAMVVGGIALLAIALPVVSASHALVARTHVAAAADAAALAAADSASGWIDSDPCTLAEEIAREYAATLVSCDVDISTGEARIVASAETVFGAVEARARAGPPLTPVENKYS